MTSTVDDLHDGTRTARGDWVPNHRAEYPAVFVWPPKPKGIARWLFGVPGYLVSFHSVVGLITAAVWWWLTPSFDTMRSFRPGWIAFLLVRNAVLVTLWVGAFHWWLYVRRGQGNQFKYNGKWPAPNARLFKFNNQLKDNLFHTFASGVPIWTAYEVFTMWMFANGHIPWLRWADHKVWFVVLFLLIPIFRDIHFYAIHRLIHLKALYKPIHHLHHLNANTAPWSGLAMHPVEHLLYYSSVLIHWIVPSHPSHALYNLFHLSLMPAPGHTGFERIVITKRVSIPTGAWAHYLHHKYVEVNYADGTVPLDRWFGSFHDGSPEADQQMRARRLANRIPVGSE